MMSPLSLRNDNVQRPRDFGKLGELASNGVKKAAHRIGGESDKFAIHSKGLEIPAYRPRAA
jgi:aldehyde:ferredoxin oxidoreductase